MSSCTSQFQVRPSIIISANKFTHSPNHLLRPNEATLNTCKINSRNPQRSQILQSCILNYWYKKCTKTKLLVISLHRHLKTQVIIPLVNLYEICPLTLSFKILSLYLVQSPLPVFLPLVHYINAMLKCCQDASSCGLKSD